MSTIGFLGLGKMGGAIARRLVATGAELIVSDPDPAALEDIVSRGGVSARTPREVADRAAIVIACLPTPQICRQVALGSDGVIGGRAIKYLIETSTMGSTASAEIAQCLQARGVVMLDSPISGSPIVAEAGQLTSIVAAPSKALDDCRDTLMSYSARIFHVSNTQGNAQMSKLINNAISIFAMLVTFEGVAVGEHAGVDLSTMIDVLNTSSGVTFTSQVIIPNYIMNSENTGIGRAEILRKDIDLYIREAERLGYDTPLANLLNNVVKQATPDGDAEVSTTLHEYFKRSVQPR